MNEYKSPIEMAIETTYKEVTDKEDNAILEAVQKVGITVDKNELIKALRYDRDQYDHGYQKGFFDGYEQGKKETARDMLKAIKNFLDEDDYNNHYYFEILAIAMEYGVEVD